LLADQLGLLLRGFAGQLAQVAVHLDGDAPEAPEVAAGVGVGQVAEQPVERARARGVVAREQLEAVADQVVVGLLIQGAPELGFPDGVAPVERPALLRRVAVGGQDEGHGFAHDLAGVRRPAPGSFHAQDPARRRVGDAGGVRGALFLRGFRFEVLREGGFGGGAGVAAGRQHVRDGEGPAAAPLAAQPPLQAGGQRRPEDGQQRVAVAV